MNCGAGVKVSGRVDGFCNFCSIISVSVRVISI
jgi:hypothetical protein